MWSPDSKRQALPFEDALAFVDAAAGGRVPLHCAAGGSRSAALALAWAMREKQLGYDDALAELRARRWVEPNAGFEEQLRAREAGT